MKCNIVKTSHLTAVDEQGGIYNLKNFPESSYQTEILYSDVEGTIEEVIAKASFMGCSIKTSNFIIDQNQLEAVKKKIKI